MRKDGSIRLYKGDFTEEEWNIMKKKRKEEKEETVRKRQERVRINKEVNKQKRILIEIDKELKEEFPKEKKRKSQPRKKSDLSESSYDKIIKSALRRYYGITLEEYNKMFEEQNGKCYICDKTPQEAGKRLCVDHNHTTKEVRGLLCYRCNSGIGLLQDDKNIIKKAFEYLKKFDKN